MPWWFKDLLSSANSAIPLRSPRSKSFPATFAKNIAKGRAESPGVKQHYVIQPPAQRLFRSSFGILEMYAGPEEHRRHRQRHEHHLHGDVSADDRGELS